MISKNELELEMFSIIGGATDTLCFYINDTRGNALNLTGATITWTMCEIGQKDYPLVTKNNKLIGGISITGDGLCNVLLSKNDTYNLGDVKVEHELIVEQANGKIIRPCYGYIYIKQGSKY